MLYTLCYQFENDFCLKFAHGEQLRRDIRNRSSKIELLSIGKKTSFSYLFGGMLTVETICLRYFSRMLLVFINLNNYTGQCVLN